MALASRFDIMRLLPRLEAMAVRLVAAAAEVYPRSRYCAIVLLKQLLLAWYVVRAAGPAGSIQFIGCSGMIASRR